MKVLKFGGTSVGTVESLSNVKKIVEAIGERAVVVVSALGGLTDKLIATARDAADGKESYRQAMEEISSRHFHIISTLVDESRRPEVITTVSHLLGELKRIYDGIFLIGDLPVKTLDVVVSFGERMSSVIVTAIIKNASRFDSLEFVKTEKWFDKNIADQKLTTRLIQEAFSRPFETAVAPGFISTDRETGEITNLGRGGSDFTAALIAAALDAEVLEIWTDVDGFMTADPRLVKEAAVVPHMTFVESMELCSFGAKVIYPPTIYPVFHKNIPIRILNTFNPDAPGTLITDVPSPDDFPVKGISTLRATTLFTFRAGVETSVEELTTRSLDTLSRQGIRSFMVEIPEPSGTFSFGVADSDAEIALKMLETEFAPELADGNLTTPDITGNLSTLAVVGQDMKEQRRLADRIRHSLHRDGINVPAFSIGVSDTTLAFMVETDKAERALALIHGLVF